MTLTKEKKSKTELLVIGLIIQLLGFFCFLTFWLIYLAIAFFIVGLIFIISSRKKWYLQIISILPMLIAIGIIVNAVTFEKYIIPKNFKGSVYVITDKEVGEKREYNLFTRVFIIPETGVLFTKFNQTQAFNYRKFYQEDETGNLNELGTLDYRNYIEKWVVNPPKTEPSRDSLAVFTPQIEYDFDSNSHRTVFTVGKYKDIKYWNFIPKKKVDSLRKLIIKN